MAGVWVVKGVTLQPIRRVDDASILHPDHRDSVAVQELLANCHHNKFWLLCGCIKPDARMFVRLVNGRYTLVNHFEHGHHAKHCQLHTVIGDVVSGSDDPSPDARDSTQALKQSDYRLIAAYSKKALDQGISFDEDDSPLMEQLGAKDSDPTSKKTDAEKPTNPAGKVDILFRLLWQLMDDSFVVYRHHRQALSSTAFLMKLRAAGYQINLKGFGSLDQFTYVGPKGLGMLFEKINRAHKHAPKNRHQCLFLAVITNFAQSGFGVTCTLEDGSALALGTAKKGALVLNDMREGDGPFLLAAVYGYESPISDAPMIMRWALQPMASLDTLLPVSSWPERLIVKEMAKCLDDIDPVSLENKYKLWLHKPTLPVVDRLTGQWLQPVISLMAKDVRSERCRVAFRAPDEFDSQEAYRRCFEFVQTLDMSSPASLAKTCNDMFVVGRGAIDSYYAELAKECAEQERLVVEQGIEQRMQARESELLRGDS